MKPITKRLLAVMLCAAMLLALLPTQAPQAKAYSSTDIAYPVKGGNIYFDKETGTITGADSNITSADIPAEIDGVAVTTIGSDAFWECSLTSITIPDGVTSIGSGAFFNCFSLRSITIPDSVTSIGSSAFYYCYNLRSITIPDGVTKIDSHTFRECDSLTSITVPDGVTSIGDSAFEGCDSLMSITLPDGITSIGSNAFYNTGIYNWDWDDGILYIGNYLVDAKDTATSADIMNGTVLIANEAFFGCENLTYVRIPKSVKIIGDDAFRACPKLEEVTIYADATTIGNRLFYYCTGLKHVTIRGNFTTIPSYMFYNCGDLMSITLPDSVTSIGYGAFYNCDSLKSITLPDSVKSIGDYAFYYCYNMTNVDMPTGLTTIGKHAFDYCNQLTSINIPDGVTAIDDWAFFSCGRLTDVKLPQGLTSIGIHAFTGGAMTEISIPDSVTSIDSFAFYNCDSLKSITIPGSVKTIGRSVFSDCDALTSVTILDGVTTISYAMFSSCPALTSITIPGSVTSVGEAAFYRSDGLKSVTLLDGVTTVESSAFSDCTNLKSITIPVSVTTIGSSAFYACDALADVYYYDGTREDWSKITIDTRNTDLTNARIHCKGDPIVDENLNPTMDITAGAEMSVNYSIVAADVSAYEDFYLVVEKETADGQTVSTTYGVAEEKSTRDTETRHPLTVITDPATGEALMYSATYTGINAKEMGDGFTTTLYGVTADGTTYCSVVKSSSMKEYLLSKFNDAAATAELKTMVVDMLKYGAAAQINFNYDVENLVTADLTEDQLALGTQEIPEATDHASVTGEGVNVNTNITVNSKVELGLSCIAAGQTDVKCIITDGEGKILAELATVNIGGVMYSAIYDNVGAKEMREVITATFVNGNGEAISKTVSWSVESYVAQTRARATATETEIAMVDAMLTYGDSVAAYMTAT